MKTPNPKENIHEDNMVIDDRAFPDKDQKEKSVERLAKEFCDIRFGQDKWDLASQGIKTICMDIATDAITLGLIFKSEALEYVEVCHKCNGKGWDTLAPFEGDCTNCKGIGIVPKEGNNGRL